MCGIAGIFNYKTHKPPLAVFLDRANRLNAHRGPDDEGIWTHGCIGLAHRRLSIIDISEGQQPMVCLPTLADGAETPQLAVCFNGEIYNYRQLRKDLTEQGRSFRTHSDTEVILAIYERYGARGVELLNGQFALALYDSQHNKLLLARDHLGQKPLYYVETEDGIAFASEIKALLGLLGKTPPLNAQALWDYLSLGYITGEATPLRGIRTLRPGNRLVVENGHVAVEEYWDVPVWQNNGDGRSLMRSAGGYESLVRFGLVEAVRRALVADVPVGVFLSAGIDSSSLLSIATQIQGSPLPSFTVDFEENSYAEGLDATEFARSLGSEHHVIRMIAADVPRLLDKVVWHTDSLQAMPSALPLYAVAEIAARHVKCVLHGGGGDEVFLGYPTYVADILSQAGRLPGATLAASAGLAALKMIPATHSRVGLDYKARQFLTGMTFPPERAHYHWRVIFNEEDKRQLVEPSLSKGCQHSFHVFENVFRKAGHAPLLDRAAYVDLKTWWVDMGLVQADGITMAHGLEARMPFMDPVLVELAMRIPGNQRLQFLKPKALLRRALSPMLPKNVTRRRKMGFHVPLALWFRDQLATWLDSQLSEDRLRKHGWFAASVVRQLVKEHRTRRADHSFRLWNLIVALRWKELILDREVWT